MGFVGNLPREKQWEQKKGILEITLSMPITDWMREVRQGRFRGRSLSAKELRMKLESKGAKHFFWCFI